MSSGAHSRPRIRVDFQVGFGRFWADVKPSGQSDLVNRADRFNGPSDTGNLEA